MDESNSPIEPSSLRRLNDHKNHHHLFALQINSLNDKDFMIALKDPLKGGHARTTIPSAAIREDNIKSHKEIGKAKVTGKEINLVLKSNHLNTILDFLHSLDDNTLRMVSSSDRAMRVIRSDHALSERYASIEDEVSPKRRSSLSPRYTQEEIPVFSLDRDM